MPYKKLTVLLGFCLALSFFVSIYRADAYAGDEEKNTPTEILIWQKYRFELWEGEDSKTLRILHNGKQIYEKHNSSLDAEIATEGNSGLAIETADLFQASDNEMSHSSFTDAGKPEILITDYSGGAHCCFQQSLLRLGKETKEIKLPSANHGTGKFTEIDHKPPEEFVVADGTYEYFPAGFASSPFPWIVYQYRKSCDCYSPSLKLTQLVSMADVERLSVSLRQALRAHKLDEDDLKLRLYELVLTTIYGGRWQLANEELLRYWPGDKTNPTAREIWTDLICKMRKSEFVQKTKMLDGAPIELLNDVNCIKDKEKNIQDIEEQEFRLEHLQR